MRPIRWTRCCTLTLALAAATPLFLDAGGRPIQAQPANKPQAAVRPAGAEAKPKRASSPAAVPGAKAAPAGSGKATGAERALSPLERARRQLSEPDPAAIRAGLEQLGTMKNPAAVAIVSDRLRQGLPPALTDMAVDLLVASASPQAAPVLTELSEHRRPEVRAAAVRALGVLRVKSARPVLRRALDDPESRVRAAAALALGQVGDRQSLKDLYLAFDRGEPRALDAIAALVSAQDVARMLGYLDQFPMSALRRAYNAMLARKDLSWPGKQAFVDGLAERATVDTDDFLRDLQVNLPEADQVALSGAVGVAIARSTRTRIERSKAEREAPPAPAAGSKAGEGEGRAAEPVGGDKPSGKAPAPAGKSGAKEAKP